MDHPVLARPTWGIPAEAPPSEAHACVPSPFASLAALCVTYLLFCLKLPTSFIIDSSLSFQVSSLHGSTNCPLLRSLFPAHLGTLALGSWEVLESHTRLF